jgi:hypothetical protein
LAADTGALLAAKDGGLGPAHVVAVSAEDRMGLEYVQFEQFHVFVV